MNKIILTSIMFCFCSVQLSAQEQDSLLADSLIAIDSTILQDSTSQLSFEERFKKHKESKKIRSQRFSFTDSLLAYFVSERQNVKSDIEKSFVHDPGDYFKFDPSFFITEYQSSPMRKTVQPFGLKGNRLNYLQGGVQLIPFGHIPEPDGLVDMNDFPIGYSDNVYIIPGAMGMLFGGSDAIATVLTTPREIDSGDYDAYSGISADNGSLGYSYTRGKYSRKFRSGKEIDLSIGYRDADGFGDINGFVGGQDDDSYHYLSDFYFPIGEKKAITVFGQLYNRTGNLEFHRDVNAFGISRERFDRNVIVSYESLNEEGNGNRVATYHHSRQGSYTSSNYLSRFNLTGHSFSIRQESIANGKLIKLELTGSYNKYDQGFNSHERISNKLQGTFAKILGETKHAFTFGFEKSEDVELLVDFSYSLFREKEKSLFSLSIGLNSKAPTLHQLYLRDQKFALYTISDPNYREFGDSLLSPEKQLVANLNYSYGTNENNLSLAITGGIIDDAIEWDNQRVVSTKTIEAFSPRNDDISFFNATIKQEFQYKKTLSLSGGLSYHYLKYDSLINLSYQPKFQVFAAGELHHYWKSKLMDIFAYSEIIYSSEYEGYSVAGNRILGKTAIINSKLSFQIKEFRFSYIFINSLNQIYESRQDMIMPVLFTHYNLTWNFLD